MGKISTLQSEWLPGTLLGDLDVAGVGQDLVDRIDAIFDSYGADKTTFPERPPDSGIVDADAEVIAAVEATGAHAVPVVEVEYGQYQCDACRGEAFAIEVCAGKLRVTCLRCKRVFQIEAMN